MPLHVSSTVVLIIRRSKFYYTASGIITLKQVSGIKLLKCNMLIFIELHFSNSIPLTCFIVTIPDAV